MSPLAVVWKKYPTPGRLLLTMPSAAAGLTEEQ